MTTIVMNIDSWLEGIGLGQYAGLFRSNDIDGKLLLRLTGEDLKEIGVTSLGHRKKLLEAIAALCDVRGLPPAAVAPATVSTPERRQLTVMFVDLVGSTALSKQLDPEDMRELIRAYQNGVEREISRFEGYIAQFLGDGLLVYFGWPKAHEDDAERAVRAGLAVISAASQLTTPSAKRLQTRVGIATGLVVVGDLIAEGTTRRHAVVGETPNLAARLQGIAEPDAVVIAEATRRLVGDLFVLRELGLQRLKGIPEATPAYEVLAARTLETRFAARHGSEVTPIVGRDYELAMLAEQWHQTTSGNGHVVLLIGEAGIGKSRLAEALVDVVGREPHFLVRYQCSPYHTESAFYPVIQHLSNAAGFREDDAAEQRLERLESLLATGANDVGEAATLIAALMGIEGSPPIVTRTLTPQQRRKRTLAAVVNHLTALARRKPVLWVIEDAHWIDPTTRDLIGLVLDRLQGNSILALVTARPGDAAPFIDHPAAMTLALDRLKRAETQAIINRIARGKPIPQLVLDKIAAATDGVPLFVEETTKALLESGILREAADGWQVAAPWAHLSIPMSLNDSLMARLDRLQPAVKKLAQMAAVIGRQFDRFTLGELSQLPNDELSMALEDLLASGLIHRDGEMPERQYQFKHALLRDAAYESLLKTSRRELHLLLLDILSKDQASAPEILAHHAQEGGDIAKAIVYWQEAAKAASRRYAHREAAALYAAALQIADVLNPEAQAALLESCAWENRIIDDVTIAIDRYEQALEIWKTMGRVLDQGRVMPHLARVYWLRARGADCLRLTRAAVELLQPFPDSVEYLDALSALTRVEMRFGHSATAIELGSRALSMAEERGNERLIAQILIDVGTAHCQLGEIDVGIALLERSLALGRKNRDQEAIARALIELNFILVAFREYERAEKVAQECANTFRIGDDSEIFYWQGTTHLAQLHLERGRWDDAKSHAVNLLSHLRGSGALPLRVMSLVAIARLDALRQCGAPSVELQRAMELADQSGAPYRMVPAALVRCEVLWLEGQSLGSDEAKFRSLYDSLRALGWKPYLDDFGYWLWCHGVAVEGIDPTSARGLQIAGRWHEAAQAWRKIGCPLEEAQALSQGDMHAVEQARKIYEHLGARAYLARVSGN